MSKGKSFSFMVAAYNFLAEILRVYGSIDVAKEKGAFDILTIKYLTGERSMLNLKYSEVGDYVDNSEIIKYYNKIKLLPANYQKIILDNDYVKQCAEIRNLCGIH